MTICSLVVQTIPEYQDSVNESLHSMQGVEIHAQNESGKMVISIDHPSREYCSKAMTAMTHIQGVMSTSLVYEYQEDLETDEEMPQTATDQAALDQLAIHQSVLDQIELTPSALDPATLNLSGKPTTAGDTK